MEALWQTLYFIGAFIIVLFLTRAIWLALRAPKRIDELEKRVRRLENKENN